MALGNPEVWVAAVFVATELVLVSDSIMIAVGNQFFVEVVRVAGSDSEPVSPELA